MVSGTKEQQQLVKLPSLAVLMFLMCSLQGARPAIASCVEQLHAVHEWPGQGPAGGGVMIKLMHACQGMFCERWHALQKVHT